MSTYLLDCRVSFYDFKIKDFRGRSNKCDIVESEKHDLAVIHKRPHGLHMIGNSSYNSRVNLNIHRNIFLSPGVVQLSCPIPKQARQWKIIGGYCVTQTIFSTIFVKLIGWNRVSKRSNQFCLLSGLYCEIPQSCIVLCWPLFKPH